VRAGTSGKGDKAADKKHGSDSDDDSDSTEDEDEGEGANGGTPATAGEGEGKEVAVVIDSAEEDPMVAFRKAEKQRRRLEEKQRAAERKARHRVRFGGAGWGVGRWRSRLAAG
jgi:hypothetical protein